MKRIWKCINPDRKDLTWEAEEGYRLYVVVRVDNQGNFGPVISSTDYLTRAKKELWDYQVLCGRFGGAEIFVRQSQA